MLPLGIVRVLSGYPEMIYGSIRIEICEPVTFSVMAVHVRVADVDVVLRAELGFDSIEMVLQDGKRDGNAVFLPHPLLLADGPIGAAPDDVAEPERLPHPCDGDVTRRVADFERAVYVEADELSQLPPIPDFPRKRRKGCYFFNARPISVKNCV